MNCNKYKLRAMLGTLLIFGIGLGKVIDYTIYLDLNIIYIIIFIFFFLGLYLLLPYVKCLMDYNDINKPPY